MTNLDDILTKDELPRTKEFWLEMNSRLKAAGLPQVIVTDKKVYKDDIHRLLDIGYELEES